MKTKLTILVIGLLAIYHIVTATNSFTIVNDELVQTDSNDTLQSDGADILASPDEVDYTGIPFMKKYLPVMEVKTETKVFEVSAYNTTIAQCDNNPCIAASGKNICGRGDVIACPIRYKFGTRMQILDKIYTCEDRTAKKYGNRIDINFDKDIDGAKEWGIKQLKILVLK